MEKIAEFKRYHQELIDFLETPKVIGDLGFIEKMKAAVELAIELILNGELIEEQDKHYFEGGPFLVRAMDGWGDELLDGYFMTVSYIKKNNWR